jgi:hypothetical protein
MKHIERAVASADAAGRRIDHIELTKREAAELARDVANGGLYQPLPVKTGDHYLGVRIVVEN